MKWTLVRGVGGQCVPYPSLGLWEKAPDLTQNLKLTPRSHLGSSHPEPVQASTHKSVKSSRVSSGVNTSSRPITWGTRVRQNGKHIADARTQCAPGWHCTPGRKPSYNYPRLFHCAHCQLSPHPGTFAHRHRLFLDADSRDTLGGGAVSSLG